MELTCPICNKIHTSELPDDNEETLPVIKIKGIWMCQTCVPIFRQAIIEKKETERTDIIALAVELKKVK